MRDVARQLKNLNETLKQLIEVLSELLSKF